MAVPDGRGDATSGTVQGRAILRGPGNIRQDAAPASGDEQRPYGLTAPWLVVRLRRGSRLLLGVGDRLGRVDRLRRLCLTGRGNLFQALIERHDFFVQRGVLPA